MDWNEVNKRINDLPGCPAENYGQFCKICGKLIPMSKTVEFCSDCKASMKRNGFARVVFCKDCKHRDPEDGKCDSGHDIKWNLSRPDLWFCADGAKKDGERE